MSDFEMRVGNVEIIALTDMNCPYPTPLAELWANVPYESWEPYREMYPDTFEGERMRIEVGCYLIRSQGKTILIDTGYGPGPIDYIGGRRGQLMAELASRSVDPADVNTVFLSHLHLDHVGWNTKEQNGEYVAVFPKARYVVHQSDIDHFRRPDIQTAGRYPYFDRLVEPLVNLGVLDGLSGDTYLTDEVRAVHTPGHTPGHMSVAVSSGGQKALIQGDVLIHPAQVTEVEWTPLFDGDPETAIQTRRRLLEQMEIDGTTIVSCHFTKPGFGRIVRADGKRYWQIGK